MIEQLFQHPPPNGVIHLLGGSRQQRRKSVRRLVNGGAPLCLQPFQKRQLEAGLLIKRRPEGRRPAVGWFQNFGYAPVLHSMEPIMVLYAVPQLPISQNDALIRRQLQSGAGRLKTPPPNRTDRASGFTAALFNRI